MTPKEKAEELLSKYTSITLKEVQPGIFLAFNHELCKKFALIAVDEMIKMYNEMNVNGFLKPNSVGFIINDVKNEIEKL